MLSSSFPYLTHHEQYKKLKVEDTSEASQRHNIILKTPGLQPSGTSDFIEFYPSKSQCCEASANINEEGVLNDHNSMSFIKNVSNQPSISNQNNYLTTSSTSASPFSQTLHSLSGYLSQQQQIFPALSPIINGVLSSLQPIATAFLGYNPLMFLQFKQNEQSNSLQKDQATSLKSAQSKFKNAYGLVLGRVIKSLREFLDLNKQKDATQKHFYRLRYIGEFICKFEDLEELRRYLDDFHQKNRGTTIRNRGKRTVMEFLRQNTGLGLMLLDIVIDFLSFENADFNDYVTGSRQIKSIGKVLKDSKNLQQLRDTFKAMKDDLWKLHYIKQEQHTEDVKDEDI